MMPVSCDSTAPVQARLGSSASRVFARQEREAFDAVDQALLVDALDLGLFEIVGRDDELAAFGVRHAVARAEGIEHAPPATQWRARREPEG